MQGRDKCAPDRQPELPARREYVAAFLEIARRISASLKGLPKVALPVQAYVAGGAALHFYTGERVTQDIDAAFSRRIALPDNLEVSYRDADGAAQLLYLDRQYSDTLALIHENAHDESEPLALPGLEPEILDVRLLTPTDLAVTKIGRMTSQDRDDIAALARRGLLHSASLRARAEDAVGDFVGDTIRLRGNIESACRIVADVESRSAQPLASNGNALECNAPANIAENVYSGNAMTRRMFFHYGVQLPRSPFGHVDQSIGENTAAGNLGLIEPSRNVAKVFEEITLDGVKMEFQSTPGTEAPAEMNTYFPQFMAFWAAVNITGTIHNIYTLRGEYAGSRYTTDEHSLAARASRAAGPARRYRLDPFRTCPGASGRTRTAGRCTGPSGHPQRRRSADDHARGALFA